MKRKIAVLGATGSIGESTFKVLRAFPERFQVTMLAANQNVKRLAEQAEILGASCAVTADHGKLDELKALLPQGCKAAAGIEAVTEFCASDEVDVVLCAIVGTAGLMPVLAALRAGKTVALASKEVMVMAGEIVNKVLSESSGRIVPVDSEHSAIYQCLESRNMADVAKLVLTCSGGPFREWPAEKIFTASAADALRHPVWSMGAKITIDSSTLMNKALELVEAKFLFNAAPEQLEVIIHPESIVHSMVKFKDGAFLAQLSAPDMRFAIQYALSCPGRWNGALPGLDLTKQPLTFFKPDTEKFPALTVAGEVLQRGGCAPAVMNAANEVAVAAFLRNEIKYREIIDSVQHVLSVIPDIPQNDLETVVAADKEARIRAEEFLHKIQK